MKMRQILNALIVLFIAATLARDVHCQLSQNRLSDNIIPRIYDIFIRVDIEARVFSGFVAIDVHVNRDVSIIQMHNIGLTINDKVLVKSVVDNSTIAESINILYDNATEIMNIVLDRTLLADSDYRLTLSFTGLIQSDMKGLYLSSYYDGGVK